MAGMGGRRGDRRDGQRGGSDGNRDQGRVARQAERAAEARRHTEEMARDHAEEIERTLAELRVYEGVPKPARGAGDGPEPVGPPVVTVVDQDSVTAVLERGRGIASRCDLAVLDFASFTHPGGGYDRGTMAQEESLSAESFLYNCLVAQRGWYAENRRHNINCELYRERALALPKVRFERDRYHSYADVIVAAAPNARRARAEYKVSEEDLLAALRRRIRLVMGVADDLGHERLVLGAFGCGVFGWDASVVARAFLDELAGGGHVAREVIFAIPRTRREDNLARFQHAFAHFPEPNDGPYVPAPAEPERPRRAERDAEQDEGEEDWRKYL